MDKLVSANLVPSNWSSNQYKGIVTDSVATLIVRKGNPLGHHTWDDLIKPGVKVVTPNPLSSGSACWNLMAAYGAELKEGKTPTAGAGLRQDAAAAHRRPSRPAARTPPRHSSAAPATC